MKKGFTLIEMLVVVLIIGILAGVALPQYTNAVRKARVAEAKITLRALSDAADRWYLNNDVGYPHLADLYSETDMPSENKYWNIYDNECTGGGCSLIAEPKWENDYSLYFYSTSYDGGGHEFSGKFECCADNDNGKKICKQLGGKVEEDDEDCFIL